ncbi:MAG: alpha/beta fold hydrolase [Microcella sp.]|nr:alpha/beta fold hydrolase [Microcella sp.]
MIELDPLRLSVAVPGGDLAVGVFNGDVRDGVPVLAVHGITANHRCWPLVAEALPGVRIIAPDLRGRGRSNEVRGEAGLRQHAADLIAVLDALEVPTVHLLAHSMGAFVAVLAAAHHPERVLSLTLVDGGLPLGAPPTAATSAPGTSVLGPAGDRLSMTFTSADEYRGFWQRHPAFADHWSPTVQGYVDYDLVGTAPRLHPSGVLAAVEADAAELYGPPWYLDAMQEVRAPSTFVRAPRGLLDEPKALYAPGRAELEPRLPGMRVVEVDDVNHYTIVLARHGAAVVADEVRRLMAVAETTTPHLMTNEGALPP